MDKSAVVKLFDSPEMREAIRRYIRAQMAYKGMEYKDLSAKLGALGVVQTDSNLRSKVNNGSLGAQLFVYILMAMGVPRFDLEQMQQILGEIRSNDVSWVKPVGSDLLE